MVKYVTKQLIQMNACPSQLTVNYVHGNCTKLWFTLQIIFSFVDGNVMCVSFKMSFAY